MYPATNANSASYPQRDGKWVRPKSSGTVLLAGRDNHNLASHWPCITDSLIYPLTGAVAAMWIECGVLYIFSFLSLGWKKLCNSKSLQMSTDHKLPRNGHDLFKILECHFGMPLILGTNMVNTQVYWLQQTLATGDKLLKSAWRGQGCVIHFSKFETSSFSIQHYRIEN